MRGCQLVVAEARQDYDLLLFDGDPIISHLRSEVFKRDARASLIEHPAISVF